MMVISVPSRRRHSHKAGDGGHQLVVLESCWAKEAVGSQFTTALANHRAFSELLTVKSLSSRLPRENTKSVGSNSHNRNSEKDALRSLFQNKSIRSSGEDFLTISTTTCLLTETTELVPSVSQRVDMANDQCVEKHHEELLSL